MRLHDSLLLSLPSAQSGEQSNMKRSELRGEALLLLAAVLWGTCFTVQKEGMDYIQPFTLGAFRFFLGGIVLLPVLLFLSKREHQTPFKNQPQNRKTLWLGGVLCGAALFAAASLQQIGLIETTAGKAAFLTSMELVVVELFGILISKKIRIPTLVGVILAILGMYLLCVCHGLGMEFGDVLELIGALFWGIQILLIDKYARLVDGIKLSFLQFLVAGALSLLSMFAFESPQWECIVKCAIPILYTGIIEVAVCYTLQIIGQKHVCPAVAAVTLSLESVFAVIFGAIAIQELVTRRELTGMILMLIAVIVIQVPSELKFTIKKKRYPQE